MLRVVRSSITVPALAVVGLCLFGVISRWAGHWAAKEDDAAIPLPKVVIWKSPKTPLDLLQAHRLRLVELEAWAKRWTAAHSTTQPSDIANSGPNDLNDIEDQVAKSDLSAMECMQMTRMVGSQGDVAAAKVFATSGIDRAQHELAGVGRDDRSVIPLRDAIHSAEDVLWDHWGNSNLLERMTSLVMRFDPRDEWDQTPLWSRIGHAEALMNGRHYEQSLAEINAVFQTISDPNQLHTEDQETEAHWCKGLIFYSTHSYDGAVPELTMAARRPSFHHSKDAWPFLIRALCRLHRGFEAEAAFGQYSRVYEISDSEAVGFSGLIVDAIYNENWEKAHSHPSTE
jgi:hypothetical protein